MLLLLQLPSLEEAVVPAQFNPQKQTPLATSCSVQAMSRALNFLNLFCDDRGLGTLALPRLQDHSHARPGEGSDGEQKSAKIRWGYLGLGVGTMLTLSSTCRWTCPAVSPSSDLEILAIAATTSLTGAKTFLPEVSWPKVRRSSSTG